MIQAEAQSTATRIWCQEQSSMEVQLTLSCRATFDQIRQHPWLKSELSLGQTRPQPNPNRPSDPGTPMLAPRPITMVGIDSMQIHWNLFCTIWQPEVSYRKVDDPFCCSVSEEEIMINIFYTGRETLKFAEKWDPVNKIAILSFLQPFLLDLLSFDLSLSLEASKNYEQFLNEIN